MGRASDEAVVGSSRVSANGSMEAAIWKLVSFPDETTEVPFAGRDCRVRLDRAFARSVGRKLTSARS